MVLGIFCIRHGRSIHPPDSVGKVESPSSESEDFLCVLSATWGEPYQILGESLFRIITRNRFEKMWSVPKSVTYYLGFVISVVEGVSVGTERIQAIEKLKTSTFCNNRGSELC